jgi:pimeloyl-ACP methyl ester carboxylesterase
MKRSILFLAFLISAVAISVSFGSVDANAQVQVRAEEKLGVLLMHGKWGTSLPGSPIGDLANSLEKKGFLVSAPANMPWSRERKYDKTFDESMMEINERVEELRKRGATKIVVGGHSIGANGALGYGARRDGLSGILAIGPGHIPEDKAFQNKIDNDWKRAKEMVESGKGDKMDEFNDLNQGNKRMIKMKAVVYLSWFDPKGPAVMPVNAAKLKSGTPLLWIVGAKDFIIFSRGKDYAFSKAPSNPKNAYIVVKGGHKMTPQIGEPEIISWLNNL